MNSSRLAILLFLCACAFAAVGCGGETRSPQETPDTTGFPAVEGRTLQQMADIARGQLNVAWGASVFTPGTARLPFGLFDDSQEKIDRPSAVYIARRGEDRANGPFPATLNSLAVSAPFRSQSVADSDPKSVFVARVPFESTGGYQVLILTKSNKGWNAGVSAIPVKRNRKIPAVGDPAPRISTPVAAPGSRTLSAIDTRRPYDEMHSVDFKDVVGRKPVALLFATPQLCSSRLCGPVTDIAAELQSKYGDRMTFIHNEVFVDNDAKKTYRPQLKAFGLLTEPWLFVMDRTGRVAARLEGAFGFDEFEAAIKEGLDSK